MGRLMQCPTCGELLSTEAPACPKCGQPNTEENKTKAEAKTRKAGIGCLFIIAVIGLLIVLGTFMAKDQSPPEPTQQKSATQKLTPAEAVLQIEKQAKEATGRANAALEAINKPQKNLTGDKLADLVVMAHAACGDVLDHLKKIQIPPGLDSTTEGNLRTYVDLLVKAYENKRSLFDEVATATLENRKPSDALNGLADKDKAFLFLAASELNTAKMRVGLPSAFDSLGNKP